MAERDKFPNRGNDAFGKLSAAKHDFPVIKRDIAELASRNDYVIFAQDFFGVKLRKKIFVVERKKSAIVHKADKILARMFPNPIQRGNFVQIRIEAADIVVGIVAEVAEIFMGKNPARVNDFIAFGQIF